MRRAAAGFLLIVASAGLLHAQETQPPGGQQPLEGQDQPPPSEPPPQAAPPKPVPPAPDAATLSLGEFLIRAATQMKLPAPVTGFTPESAAWALVQKGMKARPELGSPLVEADIASMLAALGYKVRTTTPSRVVTRERAEAILGVFFTSQVTPGA